MCGMQSHAHDSAPEARGAFLMRYLYITAMGFVTLRDEPPLTLTALQDLVGGYLEEIFSTERVPGATRMAVLDNEEGVLLNLAPSVRFPQVYSVDGVLRGAVVI